MFSELLHWVPPILSVALWRSRLFLQTAAGALWRKRELLQRATLGIRGTQLRSSNKLGLCIKDTIYTGNYSTYVELMYGGSLSTSVNFLNQIKKEEIEQNQKNEALFGHQTLVLAPRGARTRYLSMTNQASNHANKVPLLIFSINCWSLTTSVPLSQLLTRG